MKEKALMLTHLTRLRNLIQRVYALEILRHRFLEQDLNVVHGKTVAIDIVLDYCGIIVTIRAFSAFASPATRLYFAHRGFFQMNHTVWFAIDACAR